MAASVSREEWLRARRQLLEKEKQLTRLRDELSAQRRALPRLKVDKDYRFNSEHGEQSLADLFQGCSQLLVYHFMFGPDWEQGCTSCSFWADNYNGVIRHLQARDVQLVAVSRAPLERLLAYRQRMGWQFPWVSSQDSDFNFDFHVSFTAEQQAGAPAEYNFRTAKSVGEELPGVSVFVRDGESIYHTYSAYSRGLDAVNSAYQLLDLTPKGRDEDEFAFPMAWLQRRDQYPQTP